MAKASQPDQSPTAASAARDIDAFVRQLNVLRPVAGNGRRGRLIMAMDATLSRQPSWDMALEVQSTMFAAVAAVGTLDVQLVYFRGLNECRSSAWVSDASALGRLMQRVGCQGGTTQIGRVLKHCLAETAHAKVDALVYVGDCMEEPIDELATDAAKLGLAGVPAFVFQEGDKTAAQVAFREIARLTGGAHCRFDPSAADVLANLLKAVAVYAAGGAAALADMSRADAVAGLIARQIAGRQQPEAPA